MIHFAQFLMIIALATIARVKSYMYIKLQVDHGSCWVLVYLTKQPTTIRKAVRRPVAKVSPASPRLRRCHALRLLCPSAAAAAAVSRTQLIAWWTAMDGCMKFVLFACHWPLQ